MIHKMKLMSRLMAPCLPTASSSHTRARIDLDGAAVGHFDVGRGRRGPQDCESPLPRDQDSFADLIPAARRVSAQLCEM
jgi:hypothetical protein